MFAGLRKSLLPLLLIAVMIGMAEVAWACPNCKDALADHDSSSTGIVQGFFWSILWMLSMPVLILSGLGTYFYVLVRRARRTEPNRAAVVVSALPTWEQVMARELAQSRGSIS